MNNRKIISLFIFVLFNFLTQSAFAQSSVWKISKGESYFYLGGTIHVLTKGDHPLPDEFTTAYNDADEIMFETDIPSVSTAQYQSKMMSLMTYNDKRTLTSELEPIVYKQLEAFLTERKIAIKNFSTFQPWGLSLVLSIMEYQRLGMTGEFGVDLHFNYLALQDKKKISFLESPEAQLTALQSMAKVEPNKIVEYLLRDIKKFPTLIESMRSTWRSGDLDALANNLLVKQMKVETPVVFKAMVVDRNNNWMKIIPSLTDNEGIEFVMVGAMHLVGKEGVLHLLKKKGFKVEQL